MHKVINASRFTICVKGQVMIRIHTHTHTNDRRKKYIEIVARRLKRNHGAYEY